MTFRSYLLAQTLGVVAFNTAANVGYTWFLWGGRTPLPPGTTYLSLDRVDADLAMTPIWIGLLSVLLGTVFIRRDVADGTMLRKAGLRSHPASRWLPRSIFLRSIIVAALCALAFALPLSFILPLTGDGILTPAGAIGTKAIVTVVFSLTIVPLVVYVLTSTEILLRASPQSTPRLLTQSDRGSSFCLIQSGWATQTRGSIRCLGLRRRRREQDDPFHHRLRSRDAA